MKLTRLLSALASASILSACQSGSSLNLPRPPTASAQSQTFNDTRFEMKSCQITPERTATCELLVTNRFRDKGIDVDRRITIQDDLGNGYAVTAGGFGDGSGPPQWRQVAVADSSYRLTVVATNLSTRAKSVRAVIFTRLLVRSAQGQSLGYRDKVIFSRPAMVASAPHAPAGTPAPGSIRQPPPSTPSSSQAGPADRWQVVGYWDYDGADGSHLAAQGLVLRSGAGAGLGQHWSAHLELKNHAALPSRNRSLWPVKINTKQHRVCANFPGYPSYTTFIDMPGEAEDGVYSVAECSGD